MIFVRRFSPMLMFTAIRAASRRERGRCGSVPPRPEGPSILICVHPCHLRGEAVCVEQRSSPHMRDGDPSQPGLSVGAWHPGNAGNGDALLFQALCLFVARLAVDRTMVHLAAMNAPRFLGEIGADVVT